MAVSSGGMKTFISSPDDAMLIFNGNFATIPTNIS